MNQRNGSGGGSGSDYDTEVSHYSISELLDLVGLNGVEDIGEAEFSEVIQGFVNKYREIDITLSRFFSDVGLTLLRLFRPSTAGGGDVAWGGKGDGDGDGDGDMREGLAMRSKTKARHIIMSVCASSESCILTCGQLYPLVIVCNVCV
jgi:hypothetical protein